MDTVLLLHHCQILTVHFLQLSLELQLCSYLVDLLPYHRGLGETNISSSSFGIRSFHLSAPTWELPCVVVHRVVSSSVHAAVCTCTCNTKNLIKQKKKWTHLRNVWLFLKILLTLHWYTSMADHLNVWKNQFIHCGNLIPSGGKLRNSALHRAWRWDFS